MRSVHLKSLVLYRWFAAQRALCPQNLFSRKLQRYKCRGHTTFVLLTPACTVSIIDKIMIICNDVNKTSTSVELLAIFYVTCHKEVTYAEELSQWLDLKPSWKSGMDIMPLRIHSSLINCFNKVTFLRFYNKLKFHILSRDGKMFGLSPGIKISVLSNSEHSTFVLSTFDINMTFQWWMDIKQWSITTYLQCRLNFTVQYE